MDVLIFVLIYIFNPVSVWRILTSLSSKYNDNNNQNINNELFNKQMYRDEGKTNYNFESSWTN